MTFTPDIRTFSSAGEFVSESAVFIAQALKNGGSLALSGGSTPKPVYEALALGQAPPLDKINFFEADERYVPKDHPDSNARMIEAALGRPIIAFDTTKSIVETLADYEKKVLTYQPFDLAVLGMGTDGHTASLFPHSSALHETKRLVTHTSTDTFAIRDRLTLTFPAILGSKQMLLLISGKDKQAALDTLLHSEVSFEDFPAKKLLEHPRLTIHFFVN